jgi:hypothetical protein
MILLLVPFAAFLLMTATDRKMLVRPPTIAMAAVIAFAGALQYLPNLLAVWNAVDAPERWAERLAAFWFDVTKADWRESMVFGVNGTELPDRLRMFAFDARQQFGAGAMLLALIAAVHLWRMHRAWATLVISAYVLNTIFAFTYNVGDPHVFFLPGHYFVALAIGCFIGAAMQGTSFARRLVGSLAVAFIVWRAYDTWPVADRHTDRRAERTADRLTVGLDEREHLLVTSLNWQIENVLLYETRHRARHVAWTRLSDVFAHFPLLVRDNHAGGRDIVLTAAAAAQVSSAFGPLFPVVPDPFPPTPTLATTVASIPRGAEYVLTLLTPPRDETLDPEELQSAIGTLTGGAVPKRTPAAYEVLVGIAGQYPTYYRASARPFRERVPLGENDLEIRMESWVPLETFRRGGFGHVLLDRERVLVVERGLSLTWFGPAQPFYAAGLYAPRPRFRIPAAGTPQHALLH